MILTGRDDSIMGGIHVYGLGKWRRNVVAVQSRVKARVEVREGRLGES